MSKRKIDIDDIIQEVASAAADTMICIQCGPNKTLSYDEITRGFAKKIQRIKTKYKLK